MKKQDTQESSTQGSDAAPGTGEMEASKVTETSSPKEQEQDMPSQADGTESAGKVSAVCHSSITSVTTKWPRSCASLVRTR